MCMCADVSPHFAKQIRKARRIFLLCAAKENILCLSFFFLSFSLSPLPLFFPLSFFPLSFFPIFALSSAFPFPFFLFVYANTKDFDLEAEEEKISRSVILFFFPTNVWFSDRKKRKKVSYFNNIISKNYFVFTVAAGRIFFFFFSFSFLSFFWLLAN